MEFYDIHSHILFGVDDGASDFAMACQMAEMAYAEGIRHLCATPHYNGRKYPDDMERRKKIHMAFGQLKRHLANRYHDLVLYPGGEIMYDAECADKLAEGQLPCINHSLYALVEFKPMETYRVISQGLQQICYKGIRPVLAHIERLECLHEQWQYLDELKSAGIVLQMNTGSLIGSAFNRQVHYCRKLVQEGYVDVLGTDMHNTGKRAPVYQSAVQWIAAKCGRQRLEQLVEKHPKAILENRLLDA